MTATDAVASAVPLSVAQEALWYSSLLAPTQIPYNEAVSIRHDGPLDVAALRDAFEQIVDRHEAWRTTFGSSDGQPVQIVGPTPSIELSVTDLSQLTADEAERQACQQVAAMAQVPYDLRRGPLVRPRLIRFPGDRDRLYLAIHHLAFDGVSLSRVILPELVALYEAAHTGRDAELQQPPPRYVDFARWEQARVAGARLERRLQHWRGRLDGAPPLILPLDRSRSERPAHHGGAVPVSMPGPTVKRLREIGQSAGASLFQVLAAGWALVLGRYAGQEDVVFATAADLRQRAEFESLVGCCVTGMVLRVDLSGDPTFTQLVTRARNELLDGLDNLVPFERLVRDLHITAAPGVSPVYQTMVVLEPARAVSDEAWSLDLIDHELTDAIGAAKLDLELQLDEQPDGELVGRLIYDRSLWDRSTAIRIAEHWAQLLGSAAADPAAPISRLEMLTPAELRRQLVEWNAGETTVVTAGERPTAAATTIRDRVRERAGQQPHAPAITSGGHTISYGELAEGGDIVIADTDGGPVRLTLDGDEAAVGLVTAVAAELTIGPSDVLLLLPSMGEPALIASLWTGLIGGARVIVAPAEVARNGAEVSRLISAEGVSVLHAGHTEWQNLIETGLRPARALRALTGGGEPLTRELADAILGRCRTLWDAFVDPAIAVYCTLGRVERGDPVTIGRPLANVSAYVVDAHDRPVPVGVTGELLIAGTVAGSEAPAVPDTARRTGAAVRWLADGRLELLRAAGERSGEATMRIELM